MKIDKNHNRIILVAVLTSFLIIISTLSVYAISYIPLEKNAFPGVTSQPGDLKVYLGQIFNFGIAIAVALALIMMIWGGIEYMTTDAWNDKEAGKARITNALYGLGLALISWLILYTINPCLVNYTAENGCKTNNSLLN